MPETAGFKMKPEFPNDLVLTSKDIHRSAKNKNIWELEWEDFQTGLRR